MLKKIKNKIANKLKSWQIEKELKTSFKQNTIDTTKPAVYFDLRDKRVEPYYYPLIFFFHEAGYQVFLENKNGFLSSFHRYKDYLKSLENISLDKLKEISKTILITDQQATTSNNYLKTIQVSLNAFGRKEINKPYLLFPFAMHPNAYGQRFFEKIPELRKLNKKTGIFFSGNMLKEAYNHSIFKDFFQILDRYEILSHLDSELTEDEKFIIQNKEELDNFWKNDYQNKFVHTDWEWSPEKSKNLDIRIPSKKWHATLAQSNFFLATSGIRMPMCHNVVEAMSVGTIPIIQYANHFEPHLEHLKNCIIFENGKDLVEKVRLALNMGKAQIAEIRQGVLNYYDTFHTPQGFVKFVEEKEEGNFMVYLYATELSYLAYKNDK